MGGGRLNKKRWEVGDGMRKGGRWELEWGKSEMGDHNNNFFAFTSFMLQEQNNYLCTSKYYSHLYNFFRLANPLRGGVRPRNLRHLWVKLHEL